MARLKRTEAKTSVAPSRQGDPVLPPRRDPGREGVNGVAPWADIVNRDPSRHYVLVYKGDEAAKAQYSASEYTYHHWKFKKDSKEKDGFARDAGGRLIPACVHPRGGVTGKEGERILTFENYLMSCSQTRKAQIFHYGHNDDTGQEGADETEKRYRDLKGTNDPMSGVGNIQRGRHAYIEESSDSGHRHGEKVVENE